MAETRDWLRGLGIISDSDWTYWETRAQRTRAEASADAGARHEDAIAELSMQVRRLQVTVGVLMQALAEKGSLDTKALAPRLEAALKISGIRGAAGRNPAAAIDPEPTGPLVCVDCGTEVMVANSFLRDGARVCKDCY
jgi:hypothetical protein